MSHDYKILVIASNAKKTLILLCFLRNEIFIFFALVVIRLIKNSISFSFSENKTLRIKSTKIPTCILQVHQSIST